MAMTLRLDEQETEQLRRTAATEGRSMQDVAKTAIHVYTTNREARMRARLALVVVRDAELLNRLGA